MGLIALTFRGLHPDTPELSDDLALLYRLVADEFEVAVDDQQPLYREVEFPVIELAQALDSWLRSGMADRRGFDFEPMGGEPGALQFRPAEAGWIVDSSQRPPEAASQLITTEDLHTSVRRFLHEISLASAAVGVDFNALLVRIRRYSMEHGAGEQGDRG